MLCVVCGGFALGMWNKSSFDWPLFELVGNE